MPCTRTFVVGSILLAVVIYRFNIIALIFERPSLPISVNGFVEKEFEAVKQAFRQNYDSGLEYAGSSFSVYYKGKLVVDLWGGYSNIYTKEKWDYKTLSISFSITKGISSLCIAVLVDQGLLNYDDLVTKYWPEFGYLKENVTVRMLMSHQAGLSHLGESLDYDTVTNSEKFSKLLASAKPLWPPGTKHAYHAITFGWYVNQLLMRVDPKHRSVGQFFSEEIAIPFDLDYYVGLPINHLVDITHYIFKPKLVNLWNGLMNSHNRNLILNLMDQSSMAYKSFLLFGELTCYNFPKWLILEIPSSNGIGSTRSISKLFALLSGQIQNNLQLSESTLKVLMTPVVSDYDEVLGFKNTGGYGFWKFPNPKGDLTLLGHQGLGGQMAVMDLSQNLSMAFLNNALSEDVAGEDHRYIRLRDAVYECINNI